MKKTTIENYFGHGYYQLYRHFLLPAEQTRAEVAFLLRELRPGPGERWLDLPCGFGRHLAQLRALRRDVNLFGGDINLRYLRERGLRRAAALTACDMRRLPFADGVFHVVLNLLNSFGYYPPRPARKGRRKGTSRELDDRASLAEWARVLRPGGRLVLDLPNRRALVALVARQPMIRYSGGDYEGLEHFAWDPKREVVRNVTIWRWPGGEEHARYQLRLYTPAQIKRELARAGLRVAALYGNFHGHPFDPYESDRMLVIAEK